MVSCITVNSRCTGCGMCAEVCGRKAISMHTDAKGFWYPCVDEGKCVLCGQCVKKCPVYGDWDSASLYTVPVSYAGYNLDDEVRIGSSSGGLFSAIAMAVLNRGGVIYGASYQDDFSVEHIRVTEHSELYRLRGSKYVQSRIRSGIYQRIAEDLAAGKKVLFSGTPCQTAVVSCCYGKYANLLTVDVICHGVPSPYCWNTYLKEAGKLGTIHTINMREKSKGWNRFHMVVDYSDGRKSDVWFNDNPWGKSFVSNLFLRECCYECKFKKKVRTADISLGDFWEAARGTHTEFDDEDKGTSVILVNSQKGQQVIDSLGHCKLQMIPYEWIPERTYALVRSSGKSANRDRAFRMLEKGYTFSETVEKCTADNLAGRLLGKVRRIIKGK